MLWIVENVRKLKIFSDNPGQKNWKYSKIGDKKKKG